MYKMLAPNMCMTNNSKAVFLNCLHRGAAS